MSPQEIRLRAYNDALEFVSKNPPPQTQVLDQVSKLTDGFIKIIEGK